MTISEERMRERTKKDEPQVTDSCGCVFCDLDIPRKKVSGRWLHVKGKKQFVVCTKGER